MSLIQIQATTIVGLDGIFQILTSKQTTQRIKNVASKLWLNHKYQGRNENMEWEAVCLLTASAVVCDVRVWVVNQYQAHTVIEGSSDWLSSKLFMCSFDLSHL